ncbi:hypothetical protein CPC735_069170 [Coccidioides posadasii C735 delta SOWgp]|uniref:Uncharacterized protein n=1 Tax=Coccidioides posadasii (strain C735) TaxID=222929 RepID=C5P0M7_COCP7|nr:hypothetical protein CPC735_069170 [Coccidioides posadasii C735 delta SOWgp]EER29235.1 hypothetical protein CPC735_069170 [Coccidioides posadasii C735 delta SOWgp]|eukprot:XP_003071380.1 hypothetical protein CPC735_069170 [Coccidioides posadasii C735 delta SOWgp]
MSGPFSTLLSLPTSSMLALLLQALFAVPTAGRPNSLWHFEIANDPAPPPEEGPPLSASAVRDLSLLWREIVAIVGAYVLIVSVFLGCLLTVGRRLRRGAQQSNRTLEMEMLKPLSAPVNAISLQIPQSSKNTWPSPMSGTESECWPSPQKTKNRSFNMPWSRGESPVSPRAESISTVDENIVRADRMKAQAEMERLYAAVMEHDAQRAAEAESNGGNSPRSPRQAHPPLDNHPDGKHLRQRQQSFQSLSPVSPMSPLSRELPSPVYPEPHRPHFQEQQRRKQLHIQLPPKPHSPQHSCVATPEPQKSPFSPRNDKPSRLSALSFLSSKSRKVRRESVRNLPISPPILSPEVTTPSYPENQPLSPRIYHPGPPPLNPIQEQQEKAKAKSPRLEHPRNASVDSTFSGPPHLNLRSAGSSTSTLPFRAFNNGPMSAPPTKTTIVERRDSILGPLGPRTGIPRTPYSPYMPFTPITPLTPSRMITRQERKKMERKNGTRVQTEADLVMSDEEMWGA